MMAPLYEDAAVRLYVGDWREVLPLIEVPIDAVITDPPYSERTHEALRANARRDPAAVTRPSQLSREIGYRGWVATDAGRAAVEWGARAGGWVVIMCDHLLARTYESALDAAGRYVFAPLSYTVTGSRVRLCGDGPALWSVSIVVARPTAAPYAKWGSLPGAYVLPAGHRERKDLVGGKELWIMRELVSDYSRRGDLVLDPCAGAATTLIAARDLGRRAIGIEIDPATAELAARRLERTRGRMVQEAML